jgi:trehalose 6-phosphate synthase
MFGDACSGRACRCARSRAQDTRRTATAAAIARAYAMPLDERKDRWQAMMAVLRANSIHDWTAHFLQALGNEHEGEEIDDPLIEDARLPSAAEPRPPPAWTA